MLEINRYPGSPEDSHTIARITTFLACFRCIVNHRGFYLETMTVHTQVAQDSAGSFGYAMFKRLRRRSAKSMKRTLTQPATFAA